MQSFIPRLLALAIQTALEDTPVVCLLGPRQSGKTTLVKQLTPEALSSVLKSADTVFPPSRTRTDSGHAAQRALGAIVYVLEEFAC